MKDMKVLLMKIRNAKILLGDAFASPVSYKRNIYLYVSTLSAIINGLLRLNGAITALYRYKSANSEKFNSFLDVSELKVDYLY